MSIRFGISKTSSIFAKVILSFFPNLIGFNKITSSKIFERTTHFNILCFCVECTRNIFRTQRFFVLTESKNMHSRCIGSCRMHPLCKIQKIVVKTLYFPHPPLKRGYECILMQYNIISLLSRYVKEKIQKFPISIFLDFCLIFN